jgi:regulator of cell morphogenesis and NO signaling
MTTTSKALREIASEYPSSVSIFDRFGIDLCAMGEKSLAEACAVLSLSTEQLQEKLAELHVSAGGVSDPAGLTLTQVIQRIVRVHHRRIRYDLPALAGMAAKLLRRHPRRDEEFAPLARHMEHLRAHMLEHIGREEQVLFPLIAHMEEDSIVGYPGGAASLRSISEPIARMKQDHAASGRTMDELRRHTNDFEPPQHACPTHRALLGGLRSFVEDLRQHKHLEEGILFPRALTMGTELASRR